MRILSGSVSRRHYQVAGDNLAPIIGLISERAGLPGLIPNTFNIQLGEDYIVHPDALIAENEYNGSERIKLQRCKIAGLRALIMRPHTHEVGVDFGHGRDHLELLCNVWLRQTLGVDDGDPVQVEVEGDTDWWKESA